MWREVRMVDSGVWRLERGVDIDERSRVWREMRMVEIGEGSGVWRVVIGEDSGDS